MEFDDKGHIDEDSMDLYSMARLPGPDLDPFEEHLLVCSYCQTRLGETDQFLKTYRAVATRLEVEPPVEAGLQSRLSRLLSLPKPAWAAGLAFLALAVLGSHQWQAMRRLAAQPVAVTLAASRGSEEAGISRTVPRGKSLNITVDVTELPASPAYRFEIVDTAGKQIAQIAAAPSNGKILAHISKPLAKGLYFARIYSQSDELLREFGLGVE